MANNSLTTNLGNNSGLGLIISFFVGGRTLSKEHTEYKTGLNTMQQNRKPAEDEEKSPAGEVPAVTAAAAPTTTGATAGLVTSEIEAEGSATEVDESTTINDEKRTVKT